MGETFEHYLVEQKTERGLRQILLDLARTFPVLAGMLRGLQQGYTKNQNVYGEKQLAIDIQSNELFLEVLRKSPFVASIASEELAEAERGLYFDTDDGALNGGVSNHDVHGGAQATQRIQERALQYSVAFDPLDGSSLVDVNQSVGSIFGIYAGPDFIGKKGGDQVAALIVVYGPRLTFTITLGQGTVEFLFDEKERQFVLSGELKLAEEKKMFAPGNLRACVSEAWYLKMLEFWVMNGYTLRYSGGMVPDVNQILRKGGGVFTYPGYEGQLQGKLRLLYECAPMAFLIEQAGGSALAWMRDEADPKRLLDIVVEKLDQRTPIFLGSKKEVERVLEMLL